VVDEVDYLLSVVSIVSQCIVTYCDAVCVYAHLVLTSAPMNDEEIIVQTGDIAGVHALYFMPCIPLGSLNRVPAIIGWGKGGNVISAGWQVTLCDPIWHVSSRIP